MNIGTAGTEPVAINTTGIIVDPLDADHGLMNQESQTADSSGQPHIIISYVPERFTSCVTDYPANRTSDGRAFHLYRNSTNLWTKFEIPFPLDSVGRSQIVLDASDNAYVFMPLGRIATASKNSSWTDWKIAYDGVTDDLDVFGEVTLDKSRIPGEKIVGMFYQKNSTNITASTPSAVELVEFQLLG